MSGSQEPQTHVVSPTSADGHTQSETLHPHSRYSGYRGRFFSPWFGPRQSTGEMLPEENREATAAVSPDLPEADLPEGVSPSMHTHANEKCGERRWRWRKYWEKYGDGPGQDGVPGVPPEFAHGYPDGFRPPHFGRHHRHRYYRMRKRDYDDEPLFKEFDFV